MRHHLVVAALVAVVALLAAPVTANFQLTIVADDRRVIDLGTFGFGTGGGLDLRLDHLVMNDPASFKNGRVHNESIGFVLDRVSSTQAARQERQYAVTEGVRRRLCFINDPDLKPEIVSKATGQQKKARYLFRLDDQDMGALRTKTFHADIEVPGLYALFFYNCKGFNDTTSTVRPIAVSFHVYTKEYNLVGGVKKFLPVGERELPTLFVFVALVFIVLGALWVRQMRAQPQHVHRIHHVMLFLVVLKVLSLLFEAGKYAHFDTTGEASVWDFFYYVFLGLKGVTLFGVVVLLGIGWSVTKPFLSKQDQILLQIVIPCQIVINIVLAIVEETDEGARAWTTWVDILHILDVFCCCVVLLPIVWSIKNLREASGQDDKAVQTLARIRMFRTFYIVVVAFIYFTRILVVMIEQALPYDKEWMGKLIEEAAAIAFYIYVGRQFQPMKENPYLYLSQDDKEELERRQELGADGRDLEDLA